MPESAAPLILASTSAYRAALLRRLNIDFEQHRPDFEELAGEAMPPEELVRANTLGKAKSLQARFPEARIIASDQLAVCEGRIIGKPGTRERAIKQLQWLSGKTAGFLTGVCLLDGATSHYAMVPCRIRFRKLQPDEIRYYVDTDQPLDCAGSFKSESLGVALFEQYECADPTALIGLPLIPLCDWLRPLAR